MFKNFTNSILVVLTLLIVNPSATFANGRSDKTQRIGPLKTKDIKSYCIDFNWGTGGPNAFVKPGLWADANPTKHVAWYKVMGANAIQTFAVSPTVMLGRKMVKSPPNLD